MIKRGGGRFLSSQGVVLVTVLIIVFGLAVLGGAFALLTVTRLESSSLEVDRIRALGVAEAGVSRMLYYLISNAIPPSLINPPGELVEYIDAGGIYKYTISNFSGGTTGPWQFLSTGEITSSGVKRRVEVGVTTDYDLDFWRER